MSHLLAAAICVQAVITAYAPETVDPRWGGVARWTGERPVVGRTAACPPEWRMRRVVVSWGSQRVERTCEDTPARAYLDGRAHVDLYLSSRAVALRHGIRRGEACLVAPEPEREPPSLLYWRPPVAEAL